MKNCMVIVLCLTSLFSLSFAKNIDAEILKAINGHDCWLYNRTSDMISTDTFGVVVGFSPILVAPKVSLVSAALTGIEVLLLKNIVRRPRPFKKYKWDIKRAEASGYSMPSGHAAMAFESAYIWSEHFPKLSLLFYSMATYISISRVYYGVHYPSDVLIGAAIGYFTAYVTSKVIEPSNLKSKEISLSLKFNF
jgi:membrane-associated phospholipid phosphatase